MFLIWSDKLVFQRYLAKFEVNWDLKLLESGFIASAQVRTRSSQPPQGSAVDIIMFQPDFDDVTTAPTRPNLHIVDIITPRYDFDDVILEARGCYDNMNIYI